MLPHCETIDQNWRMMIAILKNREPTMNHGQNTNYIKHSLPHREGTPYLPNSGPLDS